MNKKQIGITLGIMCFILTLAICVQIKTMNNASSTASQTLSDNELRDNVLRWKEKYDNISETLKRAQDNLEKIRQKATQNEPILLSKEEQLKQNNTLLGLTNVKGNGIIINVEDGKNDNSILTIEDSNNKLVHNFDLLSIIYELRNSGAEAIEINGQRVINSSAITCEGNIIKINGERIGSPFEIKAIGAQGLLYGQITRPGSYLEIMQDRGVNVQVKQQDDIVIKKYNGTISYKYIKTK